MNTYEVIFELNGIRYHSIVRAPNYHDAIWKVTDQMQMYAKQVSNTLNEDYSIFWEMKKMKKEI